MKAANRRWLILLVVMLLFAPTLLFLLEQRNVSILGDPLPMSLILGGAGGLLAAGSQWIKGYGRVAAAWLVSVAVVVLQIVGIAAVVLK